LLQYGQLSAGALAALLFWRKWVYDIDNRAGQETGYVFEPIVANAIGGVSYGSKRSPIKRGGRGKGRQVDCIRDNRAYEIKLRVTIAASGQGRWGEELAFPEDCKASGYTPVLVVFDPTENEKLTALQRAFEDADGEAFIGEDAWQHLESEAGPTMARFLEKYVRRPVQELLDAAPETLPEIVFRMLDDRITITVAGELLEIERQPGEVEVEEDEAEENES
jgi:hypothetical protein